MSDNDNSQLFAEERRERILLLLKENSKLLVPELCAYFKVSPATIRNDLRDLETAGKLKRTHGGAIPVGKSSFELNSSQKEVSSQNEKRRIASKAATFIEDGDTIALDTGTTTLELAKQITNRQDLSVVTNDLVIASYLENNSNTNVILLGGMLRKGFHCTVGPAVQSQLSEYSVDKVFMAANAISLEKGFTTPGIDMAEVKKSMMSIASQVFFLIDSSKFGRITFIRFAGLGDTDKIITDEGIGKATLAQMYADYDDLEILVV
ncbi:MAG: DeoR/GlpR family DNA-binding transcription regulator [Oscillospiraceae bacterium]|nr:DeoR/GlpR family DNA-binding transcription regulator [Oscillospiraceae bacterium]